MSFKQNDMINLGNYEEYFILYMDNELPAEQKLMVENFLAQHPHLGEELDVLMSTKLPLDEISFTGKADLHSSSMKVNTVDEDLLLYIDNELPGGGRKAVEEKIAASKDYSLQYSLLLQTKLDATEKVAHPNKKELYRHTERVVAFKTWMRIAAAVVILLLGSLFFLLDGNEQSNMNTASTKQPVKHTPVIEKETSPVEKINPVIPAEEEPILVQTAEKKQREEEEATPAKKVLNKELDRATPQQEDVAYEKSREVIRFDVKAFTAVDPDITDNSVVNKTITRERVTSPVTTTYYPIEDPQEAADPGGDFKNTKKTSAKGFFRKVSRFIQRNTGIGTASADDEVLIGAVSIKLK